MFKFAPIATGMALAFVVANGSAFSKDDEADREKLGLFKKAYTAEIKTIPQTGQYADNLRKILTNITMPEGFKIELFAVVPDARQIAVSLNKTTVWVGTRKSTVWSVTDRDMDNIADTVQEFSPGVKFDATAC